MSAPRRQLSEKFRLELLKRRAAGERLYKIAAAAKVRANELSGLVTGSIPVRRDDARVLRVGVLLGLHARDCFDESGAP
jgi:hypothetical protein